MSRFRSLYIIPIIFCGVSAPLVYSLPAAEEAVTVHAQAETTGIEADAELTAPVVPTTINLHAAPAQTYRFFTAFGQPWRQQMISAEVSGRLNEITIDAGDVIENKNPLLVIDMSRLNATAARLDATLSAIEAARELLDQDIALAERRLAFQEREFERNKTLADSGSVSPTRLDSITLARDEAQLSLNRNKLREAELAAQQAQVAADRQDVSWQRERAQISGPVGWTVRQRHVHPGSIVQAGTTLLTIADTRTQRLTFHLNAAEITAIQNGQATIRPAHGNAEPRAAQISWIDPVPETVTGKRRAYIDLTGETVSGASWELTITMPDPDGGLSIPNDFMIRRFDQWYIQTTAGAWHAVVVLRRDANQSVIARPDLPADTELQVPQ